LLVDNRTFKRLAYQVLSRAPTAKDVEGFFRRFHGALEARGLTVRGVTTDGSALYPEPIAAVFGDVPHQACTSHVLPCARWSRRSPPPWPRCARN
jgi:hypothetical protein